MIISDLKNLQQDIYLLESILNQLQAEALMTVISSSPPTLSKKNKKSSKKGSKKSLKMTSSNTAITTLNDPSEELLEPYDFKVRL